MKKDISAVLLLSAVMFSGCNTDNGGDNVQKQDFNEISSEQQVTKGDIIDAKLIGSSENKEVKLYEKANGVKLVMNGKVKDFNWENPGDTGTDPQVFYKDVTGDGEKEAVIILKTGSGTELSLYDIHIVDKDLHEIKVPSYEEIVGNHMESKVVIKDGNTLGITVKAQGEEHNFDFAIDPQTDLKLEQDELYFGGQVTYFLENQKIKLNFVGSVGIYASPTYVVDIIVTYEFDDTENEFIVSQLDVKPVQNNKE
ncbi:hypothetical protein [Solibacillus daqui]|uniref:hypothetical protein n=1 Tax=Solibacillus daqui TaxID=2912187 RepID=UPI0023651883|nr:hypothetical protein [Solibacillus daqui]